MKKIIALTILAATFAATSAFSQGYLSLTVSKSGTWDDFTTPGTPATDTQIDVAMFWAAAATTPTVDSIATFTPKTGSLASTSAAWADLAGAGNANNFTLGVNANTSANIQAQVSASGGNGFGVVGVTGTSPGTSYTVFFVGWNNVGGTINTLAAAAAANVAVGWSAPVQVPFLGSSDPNLSVDAPAFGQFGVVTSVPEPGTMALAGLGGLSLLAFRRKK
jgi:hypothetical protein